MVLLFGIDVPLIEVLLGLGIIMLIVLVEVIIITAILIRHMKDMKKMSDLINKLSETMLAVKKAEIEELDLLRKHTRQDAQKESSYRR